MHVTERNVTTEPQRQYHTGFVENLLVCIHTDFFSVNKRLVHIVIQTHLQYFQFVSAVRGSVRVLHVLKGHLVLGTADIHRRDLRLQLDVVRIQWTARNIGSCKHISMLS